MLIYVLCVNICLCVARHVLKHECGGQKTMPKDGSLFPICGYQRPVSVTWVCVSVCLWACACLHCFLKSGFASVECVNPFSYECRKVSVSLKVSCVKIFLSVDQLRLLWGTLSPHLSLHMVRLQVKPHQIFGFNNVLWLNSWKCT